MKAKLPIIGQIKTGADALADDDVENIVKDYIEKLTVSSANFLGLAATSTNDLVNQKTVSTKVLEANKGWVYRNNDVIAKEVATLEFELYRVDLKGGKIEYVEIDTHPILDILDRFNDTTTKSDAIYITQSHKKLTGDSFWLLEGNGSNITNIYTLQPDKIELDLGDPTKGEPLIKAYKYKDHIDDKEVEVVYLPEQILHFKAPNPSNMYRGLGTVVALADDIDLDNLTTDVNRKFFENGAITNFVLSTEGKITDEQLKRLRAELKSAYGGASNAFKTMILSGGLKPETMQMSNKDMEFLAQLEWYRDKIMVGFGNTKASLGLTDDVNRATHESSMISWKRNSVKPEMEAIVNTLNEFLVPRWGEKLILGFKDPVGEDRDSMFVEVDKAKSFTSPNERRELLGYDPVGPEGDFIPEIQGETRSQDMAQSFQQQAVQAAPKSLKNINLMGVLRRYQVFEHQAAYMSVRRDALAVAKKLVKAKKNKAKPVISEVHTEAGLTDDQIMEYWAKQIRVVEVLEQRFKNSLVQFIDRIEKKALGNLEAEVANRSNKSYKAKELFNRADEVVQAGVDFRPILIEQATIAGQQALHLINQNDPYIPFAVRGQIDHNVKKFATSMLDTEKDKMTDIIDQGIKEGKSVPQIRSDITDTFEDLKQVQAERITRTEVLRVSNEASVDAWTQSGVVEAKQWLTAEDDRVDEDCDALNGKIIELDGTYAKSSYGDVDEPPIHPNCRCVVIPILEDSSDNSKLLERIHYLESQVDKRTKDYKAIKQLQADDKAYIKALENIVDD